MVGNETYCEKCELIRSKLVFELTILSNIMTIYHFNYQLLITLSLFPHFFLASFLSRRVPFDGLALVIVQGWVPTIVMQGEFNTNCGEMEADRRKAYIYPL